MRNLPPKPNQRQGLIIKAVRDYFGKANSEEKKSIVRISLWLMGRKKRNPLTEGEGEIMGLIRANLRDRFYSLGLA